MTAFLLAVIASSAAIQLQWTEDFLDASLKDVRLVALYLPDMTGVAWAAGHGTIAKRSGGDSNPPFNWTLCHAGKNPSDLLTGITSPDDNDNVIASGTSGSSAILMFSNNGGVSWKEDTLSATEGASGPIIFANSTHGAMHALHAPVIWTTVSGGKDVRSWDRVEVKVEGYFVGSFLNIGPSQAIPDRPRDLRMAGTSLCRSLDSGRTFSCHDIPGGPANGVRFLPTGPDASYAAGFLWGGANGTGWVRRSKDGGTTWGHADLTPPFPIVHVSTYDLAMSTGVLAAGGGDGEGGAFYSPDGGVTWSKVLSTTNPITDCASSIRDFEGAVGAGSYVISCVSSGSTSTIHSTLIMIG